VSFQKGWGDSSKKSQKTWCEKERSRVMAAKKPSNSERGGICPPRLASLKHAEFLKERRKKNKIRERKVGRPHKFI